MWRKKLRIRHTYRLIFFSGIQQTTFALPLPYYHSTASLLDFPMHKLFEAHWVHVRVQRIRMFDVAAFLLRISGG